MIVYKDYPDDVNALLDARGFSFIRKDYPVQANGLSQVGTVEALLKKKILTPPPSNMIPSWGAFAWKGTFTPMHWK